MRIRNTGFWKRLAKCMVKGRKEFNCSKVQQNKIIFIIYFKPSKDGEQLAGGASCEDLKFTREPGY